MALDLHNRDSRNAMVDAGPLATTIVVPSATPEAKRALGDYERSRLTGCRLDTDVATYDAARNLAVDTTSNGCVDVPHAGPRVAQNENGTMRRAPKSVVDACRRADRR